MQSWSLWWTVQYVMPIVWTVIPLPPCDRRVWLSSRTYRSQLWSRLELSNFTSWKYYLLLIFFRFHCNILHQQYFPDCPAGYYGKLCSEVCDNCANNSTCNPRDGHCECLPGWTSSDCSERELTGFGKYLLSFYLDDCLSFFLKNTFVFV